MLWIACPVCGPRPVEEYAFGGEQPHVPDSVTDPDARLVDHVWFLDNVEGVSVERWFHHAGCRRWLTLQRDTGTDRVVPTDHSRRADHTLPADHPHRPDGSTP